MNIGTKGILLESYSPHNQWDVIGTDTREVNTGESAVIFTVKIKRKPLFYLLNVICPVILLSLLSAFTFVLPISSGERAGYSITTFLSLAVFLTIVASELPKNSEKTSIISVYLFLMTVLSTLIVMITLCEVRLSTRTLPGDRVNAFYRFTYKFSMFLQCKSCGKAKNQIELISPEKEKSNKEFLNEETMSPKSWMDIVDGLDFLLFWLFILITSICTTVLIPLAASGGSS